MNPVRRVSPCFKSFTKRPAHAIKTHAESINELRCMQIPLSDRSSRKSSRDVYHEATAQELSAGQSITIPLRVHISLSLPPTPQVPCTTPDLSATNSDIELSCSSSSIDEQLTSTLVDTLVDYTIEKGEVSTDVYRGRSSSTTQRNARNNKISSCTIPSSTLPLKTSSKHSKGDEMNRKSWIKTSLGSPQQALRIKKLPHSTGSTEKMSKVEHCSEKKRYIQCEEEHGELKNIQVEEKKNAFIMNKDGSMKKCTVYIPYSNNDCPQYTSVINKYEVCQGQTKVLNKSKSSYVSSNIERRSQNHINKSISFEPKLLSAKKSHHKKAHRKESQTKHKQHHAGGRKVSENAIESLLPQNQHKKGQLKFSDVLNSLNNMSENKRSTQIEQHEEIFTQEEKHTVRSPALSKTELCLLNEEITDRGIRLNSKESKTKRCVSAKKTHFPKKEREDLPLGQERNHLIQSMIRKDSTNNLRKQSPKKPSSAKRRKSYGRSESQSSLSKYDYKTVVLS